jgi:hypothetical protein
MGYGNNPFGSSPYGDPQSSSFRPGVQNFYYTRELPPRSVAIASVSTQPFTPAQLTDINNIPYQQGTLGVWRGTSNLANPADFIAPDYLQSVNISGASYYYVDNQFFEITNQFAADNTALYYVHVLPQGVTQVAVLDLTDAVQTVNILISGQNLYHSMDGNAYRVRYIDSKGVLNKVLLRYGPILQELPYAPSTKGYTFQGRIVTLNGAGTFAIRFLRPNGYRVAPPYNGTPNAPWFPRVGFSLKPVAPEWARQVFLPQRPYMLASWVPGIVLDGSMIEFERKQILYNAAQLPDILVFDKDYAIKYALDGAVAGSPPKHGTLYPWKRGQIRSLDAYKARVEVDVALDPSDVVYGFYSYREQDVVYQALDVNPFTNPQVQNTVVYFYYRTNSDPFRVIYHQLTDPSGNILPGLTNDPSPVTSFSGVTVFAQMTVGTNVSPGQFTVTDERQRGGGLGTAYQQIPQAANFWDIGYLDGKPYPIAGALVVHLPVSILDTLSRDQVLEKVNAALPMGAIPVIFYYDQNGVESR